MFLILYLIKMSINSLISSLSASNINSYKRNEIPKSQDNEFQDENIDYNCYTITVNNKIINCSEYGVENEDDDIGTFIAIMQLFEILKNDNIDVEDPKELLKTRSLEEVLIMFEDLIDENDIDEDNEYNSTDNEDEINQDDIFINVNTVVINDEKSEYIYDNIFSNNGIERSENYIDNDADIEDNIM